MLYSSYGEWKRSTSMSETYLEERYINNCTMEIEIIQLKEFHCIKVKEGNAIKEEYIN